MAYIKNQNGTSSYVYDAEATRKDVLFIIKNNGDCRPLFKLCDDCPISNYRTKCTCDAKSYQFAVESYISIYGKESLVAELI